ncbi:MAG: hypothetical protein H6Q90_5861 [Deltaproteobacteria bacterium]|nr:hypothetical protein [Deltaproteobacteria bacterium]
MRASPLVVVAALASSSAAEPGLDLPEPSAPAPRVIVEDSPGPVYYRLPRDTRALSRSGLGVELRSSRAGFALDLLGGASIQLARGGRSALWIEGGYAYAGFGDHLLALGAGPAIELGPAILDEAHAVRLALVPHALIGRCDGELGYGLRTSAIASFLWYGIEVAHQYLVVGERTRHEVHVMITFPMTIGGGS